MGSFFPVDSVQKETSQPRLSSLEAFPDSLIDAPRTPVVLAGNVELAGFLKLSCWRVRARATTSNT